MRSAIAQMQLDVVNAGSGFYPGASMPFVSGDKPSSYRRKLLTV